MLGVERFITRERLPAISKSRRQEHVDAAERARFHHDTSDESEEEEPIYLDTNTLYHTYSRSVTKYILV